MYGCLSKCFSDNSGLIELEAKAKMNNLEACKNSIVMLCERGLKPGEESLSNDQ